MKPPLTVALAFLIAYVLAVFLCACSTPVPNVPLCVEVAIDRARCTTIMSGENFTVDSTHLLEGKTYWDIRPQMILMPASSWVELKKFIIDVCASTKMCQSQVSSWDRTVSTLSDELDAKQIK